ncbi:unnamed protein product [Cuscuta campestris]|uniref:UBA domain-containing protein n=2 Tax=Cuscuta sect. Cleistogrammica TaxID=1824901 RepID=A0A484K5J5_9ASTE|nr:hypothetical protein DM860_005293 [Cuscuta australis]VFQ61191.1 unnamed protein product [Cuscuta campestris]
MLLDSDPCHPSTKGSDDIDIDWSSEDDQEIQDSNCRVTASSYEEACPASTPHSSDLIQNFVGMGFPRELVAKAIEQNGDNSESILETLLTYSVLDIPFKETPCDISLQNQQCFNNEGSSSGNNDNFGDDLSDTYSWSEDDEVGNFI